MEEIVLNEDDHRYSFKDEDGQLCHCINHNGQNKDRIVIVYRYKRKIDSGYVYQMYKIISVPNPEILDTSLKFTLFQEAPR